MNRQFNYLEKVMKDETIGGYAREILLKEPGLSNQEVLDKVKAKFTDARTSIASIAWYKSDIKRRKIVAPPANKERTEEVIIDELMAARETVQGLELELEEIQKSVKQKEMAKLIELATKLGDEELLAKIKELTEGGAEQDEGGAEQDEEKVQ
jgi:hypothetical protein